MAVDLAGAHRRADPAIGCIACHGGADLPMRLRVWAVAGLDTIRFLTGAYREPDHMRLPLRDADCRRCHTPIIQIAGQAAPAPAATPTEQSADGSAILYGGTPPATTGPIAFHRVQRHDTMPFACVRCHATHLTGGDPGADFVSLAVVQPVCRDCHPTM